VINPLHIFIKKELYPIWKKKPDLLSGYLYLLHCHIIYTFQPIFYIYCNLICCLPILGVISPSAASSIVLKSDSSANCSCFRLHAHDELQTLESHTATHLTVGGPWLYTALLWGAFQFRLFSLMLTKDSQETVVKISY